MATQGDAQAPKVAVVTETYPPEVDGVAKTMLRLVEGLEGRGNAIHPLRPRRRGEAKSAAANGRRENLVPGIPISGYRGLHPGPPVYWRLRRFWRTERPDAVCIATQAPLGRAALAAARTLGIPNLTGLRTQSQQYSSHYGLGLITELIVRSLRRLHNRSD